MAKQSPTPDGNESHDAILGRIESIVNLLEQQDTQLEDSIKLFEEGTKLLTNAQNNLDKAEQRVQVLSSQSKAENTEPAPSS